MKGRSMKIALLIFMATFFQLMPLVEKVRSEETVSRPSEFQWGGSVELGYRFADIEGRPRYKEVVNLMEGLRLFELSFWAKNPTRWADLFSLQTTGIGDPFPSSRLQIRKEKAFDLVATYREYKYFFDRSDDPFFSDDHDFDQKRRRGTLTLSIFPKEDVKLNFGYGYGDRRGNALVPRAFLDLHEEDLKERINEYFVSADFPVGNWDIHLKQTFWTFENRNSIDDPILFEKRKEEIDTYVSNVKGHSRLSERWELDVGYVFSHSEGRAHGVSIPPVPPFGGSVPLKGDFDSNLHIVELGLSYLLSSHWIAHLDYRFHVESKDGYSRSEVDLPSSDLSQISHTATFQLEYLPHENLMLRAGYRFQYRDVDADQGERNPFDGGKDVEDTKILSHGWVASAEWKPSKVLSLFGEYQGANFDNPYTRISPEGESLAKLRIQYETPFPKLTLKAIASWKRRRNPDQDFRVDVQDYTLTALYRPAFASDLSLDASFTYERIRDRKDALNFSSFDFERFVFDSNALIYSGGITYEKIYKGLGARLTGVYAKTYKENAQRYGDAIFSLWYKNKWVTPILTFERTYLSDHVNRKDSFSAHLVTFSLRKEF